MKNEKAFSDNGIHDQIPSINGFRMIERRAQSATSSLWEAYQVALSRTVMIKVLSENLSRDPEDVRQFQFEATIAARLKHQGIVQVYDIGQTSHTHRHYFVMEYISGYSVGEWLRRKGRLTESDALAIAHSVADALQYAWNDSKLIHCDIKPDNIMIDGDGTVKVTDLGIAKAVSTIGLGLRPADSGEVIIMGTPNYMSPEQVRGEATLDCRTDIYALGATLYHLLTGVLPFDDDDASVVMQRQIEKPLEHPQKIDPSISDNFARLIVKMTAKNPSDRHQSWGEVLNDIVQLKNELHVGDGIYISEDRPAVTYEDTGCNKEEIMPCPYCSEPVKKILTSCPHCRKSLQLNRKTEKPEPKNKIRLKPQQQNEPLPIKVTAPKPIKQEPRQRSNWSSNLRVLISICLLIFLGYYGYNRIINNRDILLPVRIKVMTKVIPDLARMKFAWQDFLNNLMKKQEADKTVPARTSLAPQESESVEYLQEEIIQEDEVSEVAESKQTEAIQKSDSIYYSIYQSPEFLSLLNKCKEAVPAIGDDISIKLHNKRETISGTIENVNPDGIVLEVNQGHVKCPFTVMSDKARILFYPEERARKLFPQYKKKSK